MVIFNEREYIKNIIEEHDSKKNRRIRTLIKQLIKYYYTEYKNAPTKDYVQKILETIETFEYDDVVYREFMYYDYIKKTCKKAQKGEFNTYLRELEFIDVTEAELAVVSKGKNNREKKLLFTLYVLAKMFQYHSGWVNYPPSEIFKLANVSLKYEDRFLLIHELYKAGLIQLNHIIGKTGYKVELHEDSPTAVTVTLNKAFGNQYMAYIKGKDWTVCQECGRLVKKNSNHDFSTKYCKRCAEKIHNMQKIAFQTKKRKKNEDKA